MRPVSSFNFLSGFKFVHLYLRSYHRIMLKLLLVYRRFMHIYTFLFLKFFQAYEIDLFILRSLPCMDVLAWAQLPHSAHVLLASLWRDRTSKFLVVDNMRSAMQQLQSLLAIRVLLTWQG